jgi:hypothetical protein
LYKENTDCLAAIKLTNSSTITPFSTVTIPTEQGWNAVAVSKSIAVKAILI